MVAPTPRAIVALVVQHPFLAVLGVIASLGLWINYTRFSTRRRFASDLARWHSREERGEKGGDFKPPQMPYTIPWIGNSIEFFGTGPMDFWAMFTTKFPAKMGMYRLILGGDVMNLTMDQTAVRGLFNSKFIMRDEFVVDILVRSFGMDRKHAIVFESNKEVKRIPHEYLLNTDRVNELTKKFSEVLRNQIRQSPAEQTVNLLEWVSQNMFFASTTALFGSGVFEMYPDLHDDFWKLTPSIVALLMKVPKFWRPDGYIIRDRLVDGLARWQDEMLKRSGGEPEDPITGESWEPIYGARYSRARQRMYAKCGVSTRSRASADLGILFALAGNAVPLTGWVLLHILCPQNGEPLLRDIKAEVEAALKPDGSGEFDAVKLCNSPQLLSVYHEALRRYVDLVLARNITEDITFTFDDGRKTTIKQGEMAMLSTNVSHHNPESWQEPEKFCPYRFLQGGMDNPEEAARCPVFSSQDSFGKLIPFGGGRTGCPGRKFAQQEIMAGVAMVLMSFDIDVITYVDGEGKPTEEYPQGMSHYPGSGVLQRIGDVKVTLRRKHTA